MKIYLIILTKSPTLSINSSAQTFLPGLLSLHLAMQVFIPALPGIYGSGINRIKTFIYKLTTI